MKPIRLENDLMVTKDDLIIVNKGRVQANNHEQAAPHGRLFEILGRENGHRIVREIACNTVVVGGAITALENLTGVTANWKPSTIATAHGVPEATPVDGVYPTISLFGIGTGGANLDFGSIIAPNIKQRDVLEPIPLRYGAATTGDDAAKYFMKVPTSTEDVYAWYLKEFTSSPVIKTCWQNAASEDEDGTEIVTDIYDSTSSVGIESFTEIEINMTIYDGREYFETMGLTSSARFNTIGFYTGVKNQEGTEYANVRLYSVITFNNRDLSIKSKSSYLYRVYSLL